MKDVIVNFCPTGMIPHKTQTPYVPISPQEIIEQVHEANELGITLVHLHARDEFTGEPTYKASVYQKILEGIRQYCPTLVLCVSLSGRLWNEFEKRAEVLSLYPDMGSLTLSSLNFSREASINSPDIIQRLAAAMLTYGVKPELEIFDLGMVNYSKYLISKALLQPPYYFNLMVNNVAGLQMDLTHIGLTIKDLPPNSYWALGGLGDAAFQANMIALSTGGGVRVGIEDTIFYDKKRKILATNIAMIKRIHAMAEVVERKIMSPRDFGNLGFYNAKRLGKPHETLSYIGTK